MRHLVPQFIDVKDKIIFGLSFSDLVFVIGGFGGSFVIWYILSHNFPSMPFIIGLLFSSPPLIFGLALAYVEINKRPFIKYLESMFYYFISPKKYNWQKKQNQQVSTTFEDTDKKIQSNIDETLKRMTNKDDFKKRRKLKNLAVKLDMNLN